MIKLLILLVILYLIFRPKKPDYSKFKVTFGYDASDKSWVIITPWYLDNYYGYGGEYLAPLLKRYLADMHKKHISDEYAKQLIREKITQVHKGSPAYARWVYENQ